MAVWVIWLGIWCGLRVEVEVSWHLHIQRRRDRAIGSADDSGGGSGNWCCTENCSAAFENINNNYHFANSSPSLLDSLTRLQGIEQGGQLAGRILDVSLLHDHITSHRHGVGVDCPRHSADQTVVVVVGGGDEDVVVSVQFSVDLIQMNQIENGNGKLN